MANRYIKWCSKSPIYISAIKLKALLTFATIWMNLEGIMLSKRSPVDKHKYCMFSGTCGILIKTCVLVSMIFKFLFMFGGHLTYIFSYICLPVLDYYMFPNAGAIFYLPRLVMV